MPNPELSQYHDHDTDTVYDYKDATARGDINNLNTATQRNIIALYFPSTGTSSGYTQWGFTSASENYGYFDGHDMQMVRVVSIPILQILPSLYNLYIMAIMNEVSGFISAMFILIG